MGKHCKTCFYDLSHCETNECPECGRFFSLDLPKTYSKTPYSRHRHARMPFRIAIMVTAVCVIAYWARYTPSLLHAFQPSISYPGVSTISQHQTLRSQLHLYANQHNGNYPSLAQIQAWDVLTQKTDIDGNVGAGPGYVYGPYMQKPPKNGFTKSILVSAPGRTTKQDGWEYNEATGSIRLVVPTMAEFNQWGLDPADAVVSNR